MESEAGMRKVQEMTGQAQPEIPAAAPDKPKPDRVTEMAQDFIALAKEENPTDVMRALAGALGGLCWLMQVPIDRAVDHVLAVYRTNKKAAFEAAKITEAVRTGRVSVAKKEGE